MDVPLQEIDEIFKIFRLLGTPTPETWPGVQELPDYKECFPKWTAKPLHEVCLKSLLTSSPIDTFMSSELLQSCTQSSFILDCLANGSRQPQLQQRLQPWRCQPLFPLASPLSM